MITKVKNKVSWTYITSDLNREEIVGMFSKENCKKQIKREFRVRKKIKRGDNKLYVKCKGYDDSFNSWIDKKDIV